MAGAGSRFSKVGYTKPKPMIDVLGHPMIEIVVKNLTPRIPHRFIFICQRRHVIEFSLGEMLQKLAPGSSIIEVDGLTEGAACTVLKAINLINNDDQLMIANSDQYIDIDINIYLDEISKKNVDGAIMTMTANSPKWSYVTINSAKHVTRVAEKEVISSNATVGIYNFIKGKDFVSAALAMISANDRVNGEFYVAPAYNQLIEKGFKFTIYNIGNDQGVGMHGMGTPEDLELLTRNPKIRDCLK